jgi:hypothetical protein
MSIPARLVRASSAFALLAAVAAAAGAQQLGGLACLTTQPVFFNAARYLGRQNAQDTVEVNWSTSGGVGTFQPGLINTSALTCAVQAGLRGSFDVALTVTRKLGHQDSGTARVMGDLGTQLQRNIQVPRAALETDPQSYQVEVRGPIVGFFNASARATGSGPPALTAASLSSSTSVPLTGPCVPTFAVTALSLGSFGTGEAVNVSWNLVPPPCMRTNLFSVQVKLVDVDGKSIVRAVSAPATATSAQVALGQAAGQVATFEVVVSTQLSSLLSVLGTSSGNF